MGNMMTSVSDATPASISRLTAYSSLPVAIDEAEPSDDWVVELLKTLRAASSDFGSRVRATADGGVSFQQARFCARYWLARLRRRWLKLTIAGYRRSGWDRRWTIGRRLGWRSATRCDMPTRYGTALFDVQGKS